MEISIFAWYLIIINVVGFIFFAVNTLLYYYGCRITLDSLLTITSIVGGSFGIFLSMLFFDRRVVKDNMMSRVFLLCTLVIQTIILLFINGHHSDKITFAFWDFFGENKILLIYLAFINLVSFVAFALDKRKAIKHKRRIRIVTLLGLAVIGGSIGALLAMYIFRHKIRVDYFTVGVPLIILMQIVVLFYLMNAGW